MEKQKVFDLACDACGIALDNVRASKEKYFNPQKTVRIFAILATVFLVGKEVYDMVKQSKEQEDENE